MATFHSIKELARGLQQGARLLNDMFLKRKTVALRYDEALETLDGDENKLRHLIDFGVVVRSGDFVELDDMYQRFFEEVLAVNEDINIASVQTYISKLKLGMDSYLASENPGRKAQFLREVRHSFKSIEKAILASDLGINPQNDGRTIRLVFPQLTEERRKELGKQIKKTCEDTKVVLRNERRDMIEALKRLKKDNVITEDEQASIEKDVQKTLDRFIDEAEKVLKAKDAEILEV